MKVMTKKKIKKNFGTIRLRVISKKLYIYEKEKE